MDFETLRRASKVRRGSTQMGDHYWKRARSILEEARDRGGSVRPALMEAQRLLRTALAFEAQNEHFRNALNQVSTRIAGPEY